MFSRIFMTAFALVIVAQGAAQAATKSIDAQNRTLRAEGVKIDADIKALRKKSAKMDVTANQVRAKSADLMAQIEEMERKIAVAKARATKSGALAPATPKAQPRSMAKPKSKR